MTVKELIAIFCICRSFLKNDVIFSLWLFSTAITSPLVLSCCLMISGSWMDFVHTANAVLNGRRNGTANEKTSSIGSNMLIICILLTIFGALCGVFSIVAVLEDWLDDLSVVGALYLVCCHNSSNSQFKRENIRS